MNKGEIWINKQIESIYFKIIEYKKNDKWLVLYANCVSTDGEAFDIMSGEEIFTSFYKDTSGLEFPEELNYE